VEEENKPFNKETLIAEVEDQQSVIREYLYGDVLSFLRRLIDKAINQGGKVYLALYELDDEELVDLLIANKNSLDIILSNSSAPPGTHEWDSRNASARARLREARVKVQNRLFNNRHIGHNKFAVYVDGSGKPTAVMTGSTNWTSFGLCAQTNNSVILENPDIAGAYLRYWQRLNEDVIDDPDPQLDCIDQIAFARRRHRLE
jgi:phosphatidylserine/phosphatidylglycerophosphate/cardiolipin synthase-like enzyme